MAAAGAWAGRRGAARLRAALKGIRAGTDSARETVLRRVVVAAGLPEPGVNLPLTDGLGTVIAHGDLVWPQFGVVLEYEGRQHWDLVWPQFGVVLEYEGRQHWDDARQFAIDIDRHHRIAELGLRVIRVDKYLLADTARLLATIRRALPAHHTSV
jgi:hypothetical protein